MMIKNSRFSLQHQVFQNERHQTYIPVHSEVPTSSSLGYFDNRISANVSLASNYIFFIQLTANSFSQTELTYADLTIMQKPSMFSSATLGRPRNEVKRAIEPSIYAQVIIYINTSISV